LQRDPLLLVALKILLLRTNQPENNRLDIDPGKTLIAAQRRKLGDDFKAS
jgi:hypothetical protein